jgi:RNA polymerase sigma-70 factor (sigma-E family)
MMHTEVSEKHPASESALAELYVRHAPGAIGLAYLLTGDRYLAEDLAQEAFVRVAGRFRYLRVPDAFEAYLRRTIVNLFTSELRRRRLERAYLRREQREARDVREERVDVTIRDELWNALGRLPARQRAAVVLRYYEDLSERDVAEIMRCSVPAMKSLVSRGMDTLRTLVRSEDA